MHIINELRVATNPVGISLEFKLKLRKLLRVGFDKSSPLQPLPEVGVVANVTPDNHYHQ